MSISNSGGPPSSTTLIWRELLTARVSTAQEQATWKVGEVLAARVQALLPLETGPQGQTPAAGQSRLILEIGGRLLETATHLPVKPGDAIKVTIQANQQVLLQLGNSTSMVAAALKAILPQSLTATHLPAKPGDAVKVTIQANQQGPLPLGNNTSTVAAALIKAVPPQSLPESALPQAALPADTEAPQRREIPRYTATSKLLQEALSRVMPFQGRLLETLGTLIRLPPEKLTPAAGQALQQLKAAIPQAKDLVTPEGLKQAIRQSGAFSEAQLARQPVEQTQPGHTALPEARDLKYALIRLFVALNRPQTTTAQTAAAGAATSPAPLSPPWQPASSQVVQPLLFPHPEFLKPRGQANSRKEDLSTEAMLKLVAQALSRIQTTQLNSVQQRQAGPDMAPVHTWLVELPFFANQQLNLFQARIDEEKQQQKSEQGDRRQESVWRITLSFNLEPLGPMYSLVRVQGGRVSSTFWAEKDATKRLLERELPQLREALSNLGLDVESLEALQGQPSFTQTKLETSLIDVRT